MDEVLEEIGVSLPDPTPYATAAWPAARAALASEPVVAELRALLDEAHHAWLNRSA